MIARGSHGANDDVWYNPQRDDVKDEPRQQPGRGAVIAARPLPKEERSELHEIVQRAEG